MAKWILNRMTTELPPVSPPDTSETLSPVPRRPAPPVEPRPARRLWQHRNAVLAGAAVVVVLVLGIWALARRSATSGSGTAQAASLTASVARGDFIRLVRVHGTVEAVKSHTVAAPRLAGPGGGPMVITYLARAGSTVKRGDPLVEFDRQNQIKTALDRQAEYRDLEEQIKKKKADHAAAEARDATELKQAENALETAKLELRRNEVISLIDAEKNQQNLEEAQARLKQLRESFELKRVARQAELRVLEIQRDRARGAMQHAQANSEKMAIRAPLDGLVVLNTIWKGGQMGEVAEGDEVRPGVPFLQVVDPAAMQVRARVNQADIPYLQEGQPARVGLDAYSELSFAGRIERIAAIGITSSMSDDVHTFAVTFSVQGNDPKLMPDLSAAVDVELERRPGVLLVPRDAVLTENGKAYVRVKNGFGADRREVKLGPMSETQAVIESGVEQGAVVLRGK